jgi:hypothetical protein
MMARMMSPGGRPRRRVEIHHVQPAPSPAARAVATGLEKTVSPREGPREAHAAAALRSIAGMRVTGLSGAGLRGGEVLDRRSPTLLFSGWNCVAKSGPRSTAAAKVTPYVHDATLTDGSSVSG